MMSVWWWVLGGVVVTGVVTVLVAGSREQVSLSLTPSVRNESFEVIVEFPEGAPAVGQARHAHVHVFRDGQPFDVYGRGYALHFILANSQFTSFLHTLELSQHAVGVYETDVTFGPAGQYRVWVEVNDATAEQKHGEAAPLLAYSDVAVAQSVAAFTPLALVRGQQAQVGPYTVTLTHENLKAGQSSMWEVQVKDAQGQVQTLFDPEPAIAVILGPRGDNGFSFFRHGHAAPAVAGITIRYTDIFQEAGEYLYWTEIYLREGGRLAKLQVPFVLKVGK